MLATALRLALALTQAIAPEAAPADPPADAPSDDYGLEQARADVEVMLVDRGKAYIDARGRLEDHGEFAAQAVIERLDAVPAPGPAERNRLLNLLAGLQRPEHVALFGEQLRVAMRQDRPTELWLELLRKQGAAAMPVLVGLVGDKELSNADRGDLLDLLVDVTPRERLSELSPMIGRGASELQDRLRRALIRRAHADTRDDAAIAAGIEADLDADLARSAEGDRDSGDRAARLLVVRAACCAASDAFGARLESLARSADAPFSVRVAAIDGLRRLERGASVLAEVARANASAAKAGDQASEVLLSLALEAMPADQAAPLASEFALIDAPAPRLASLGYALMEPASEPGAPWLSTSQAHPWPEVRKAALDQVARTQGGEAACTKDTIRALTAIAGPDSEGGDEDARVGRSAVTALGRCDQPAAYSALRDILQDTGVALSHRAEAGRQLVLHDPEGPALVAAALVDSRFSNLARELATALGQSPVASPEVREALCRTADGSPMVASTAHDSFVALFPGERCE